MKFLAIIPARYASSRFPGKPLADILGKPMIRRVYERAAAHFNACYVATDDDRIREAVEKFGGRVVMTSETLRSGTDRCAEALDVIERQSGERFDVVVNIQGDEPFVSEEHLQKITACFSNTETRIATLIKPFGRDEDIFDPNTPKVAVSAQGFALYFSRSAIPYLRNEPQERWQQNHLYYKHIGLYAYRADTLREITQLPAGELEKAESLEQLRWLENGYAIRVAETNAENFAVDTPADLEKLVTQLRITNHEL